MNDTLIIIPTYNEKDNIEGIARAILDVMPLTDILIVDDNSPDGTGEIADRLAAGDARVHVLHREAKQGLGRAYIAGFKWALEHSYGYIFEMDADFSHNPRDIPAIREAAEQADLSLGSRYIGGIRIINWPLSRLILSKGAAVYVQWVTGMPYSDPTGGFKCYRREVLETIDLDRIASNGYAFQIEMTHQAWRFGFHIVETPITFEERRSGHSKISGYIIREGLWMVWKLLICCRFKRWPGPMHPRSVKAVAPQPDQDDPS